MTLTITDRVRETTTGTGTGTLTLAGAATGYRTFQSVVAVGDQCNYVIALDAEWEVGVGTLATSTTLARTTVLASSNAGALVDFSAGTKSVFLTQPAALVDSTLQKNRNLVDNGAMNVCQRATTVASLTTAGYWTCDRWYLNLNALGTWGQTQTTGTIPGEFRKYLETVVSTADGTPAAGDYARIEQRIEGQFLQHILKGTAAAKPLTLSFWVKSNVTGNYFIAELHDTDNDRYCSALYGISVADTWEYKTITFPPDTTGAFTNDANGSLTLLFWLAAGSTYTGGASLQTTWGTTVNKRAYGAGNLAATIGNYIVLVGVQLEVGSVPTPFETRPFDRELLKCMRYFEKSYNYADAPATATGVGAVYGIGRAQGTTSIDPGPTIVFKVMKRATPAVTFHLIAGGVPNATWLWGGAGHVANLWQTGQFGFSTYSAATLSGLVAGNLFSVVGHWTATADI